MIKNFAACLFLVAVLAAAPAAAQKTEPTQSAPTQISPEAEQAQQANPVGRWSGVINWPEGRNETATWEFRENGELIADLGNNTVTAHWTQDGGNIRIRFVYTTYIGRLGPNVMAGILMQDDYANPGRSFVLRPAN